MLCVEFAARASAATPESKQKGTTKVVPTICPNPEARKPKLATR
jgi:hypothetical protein